MSARTARGCIKEKLIETQLFALENGGQLCFVDIIGSNLAKACAHLSSPFNELSGPP